MTDGRLAHYGQIGHLESRPPRETHPLPIDRPGDRPPVANTVGDAAQRRHPPDGLSQDLTQAYRASVAHLAPYPVESDNGKVWERTAQKHAPQLVAGMKMLTPSPARAT